MVDADPLKLVEMDRCEYPEDGWLVATPPSLVGSPVKGNSWRTSSSGMNMMDQLKGVMGQAVHAREESDQLQQLVVLWEAQILQVHDELLYMRTKLERERRKHSLRVLEKEREGKRMAVEIESLRGISEARMGSLEALKVYVCIKTFYVCILIMICL